ncbi:hypothetical protein [Gordonibacter sp.]|uniref:hypothetical protein n=1 Tax=Gordonibacter sp. TaxID=1968902 RepID=UPI002FC7C973
MTEDVMVSGVSLCASYDLILQSCTEVEPEPKVCVVDVPGGDGSIDLTEALLGDVAYANRSFEFTFAAVSERDEFAQKLTSLRSFLHGKRLDFIISWDDSYVYTGRFAVKESSRVGKTAGVVVVSVSADPYKLKDTCTYRVNAAGGIVITLDSGRMPVCPTFEFASETIVAAGDISAKMQPGSYKVNDLWLHAGSNELYLNSYLGNGNVAIESHQSETIATHARERISDLLWSGVRGAAVAVEDWLLDTIGMHAESRIVDAEYAVSAADEKYAVYISYPWKDL